MNKPYKGGLQVRILLLILLVFITKLCRRNCEVRKLRVVFLFCGNFLNSSCTQSLGNLHGKTSLDRATKNPKKGVEYISI